MDKCSTIKMRGFRTRLHSSHHSFFTMWLLVIRGAAGSFTGMMNPGLLQFILLAKSRGFSFKYVMFSYIILLAKFMLHLINFRHLTIYLSVYLTLRFIFLFTHLLMTKANELLVLSNTQTIAGSLSCARTHTNTSWLHMYCSNPWKTI